MPKQKSDTVVNNPPKKISLESITGIDGSLESIERYEKVSQTDGDETLD